MSIPVLKIYDENHNPIPIPAIRGEKGDKGNTGNTGPQGEPGQDGSDAEVTEENIAAALGFTPANPSLYRTAAAQDMIDKTHVTRTELAFVNTKFKWLNELMNGQQYDTYEDTTEAYSKTVPTGAKAVSVNSFGGKSIVFNQLVPISYSSSSTINGITFTNNGDGTWTLNGTATADAFMNISQSTNRQNHKILLFGCPDGGSLSSYLLVEGWSGAYDIGNGGTGTSTASGVVVAQLRVLNGTTVNNLVFKPQLFDLTQMFGAGNEPSSIAEFRAMFPEDYYDYNEGEIVSAEVTEIESRKQDSSVIGTLTVPTALLTFLADKGYGWSVGSVYNEIDFERKKYIRRVGSVDLGTLTWNRNAYGSAYRFDSLERLNAKLAPTIVGVPNAISAYYTVTDYNDLGTTDKVLTIIWSDSYAAGQIWLRNDSYTDAAGFKAAMNGVMLYYELATPVEYDISAYLPDGDGYNLLAVESGGSLTFVQTDTELPVPNNTVYAVNLSEATT